MQERNETGRKCELQHSVAMGVWQGSTLSSATFCLTFWGKMRDLWDRKNTEEQRMGFISYADDFLISAQGDEANHLRAETSRALREVALVTDQTKMCYTQQEKNGWSHESLSQKENVVFCGS